MQEFLDFAWIDVLTAANQHVLDAADDAHVAVFIHSGEVAGVHPALEVDGLLGRRRVVPVPKHDAVPARALLARSAARHRPTRFRIDDFHLDMRMGPTDSGYTFFKRIVHSGL